MPQTYTFASWNVNGLRAVLKKDPSFIQIAQELDVDILNHTSKGRSSTLRPFLLLEFGSSLIVFDLTASIRTALRTFYFSLFF